MAPGRKGANAWIFSRGTEWKRDTAHRANGMWVFQGAASGAQPAASGAPVMKTLEAIRAEVGDVFATVYAHTVSNGSRSVRISPGHKRVVWHPTFLQTVEADISAFDMSSLGKFLPAWEVMGEVGIELAFGSNQGSQLASGGERLFHPQRGERVRRLQTRCVFSSRRP